MGLVLTKELGFLPVPTWNKEIFLDLWGFGRWVYLTQITGVLINGVDKIYLISVFGSASIPFYTFAQRIYQTVHTTLVGQAHYLFPMFSAQGDKLEEVAERTDERLRWFIGLIAGLIFSGLIIAGPALLTITVNSEFAKMLLSSYSFSAGSVIFIHIR
jgi:O-antigen/teichoic acid export membrane protein